jgi:hypothetical protein
VFLDDSYSHRLQQRFQTNQQRSILIFEAVPLVRRCRITQPWHLHIPQNLGLHYVHFAAALRALGSRGRPPPDNQDAVSFDRDLGSLVASRIPSPIAFPEN